MTGLQLVTREPAAASAEHPPDDPADSELLAAALRDRGAFAAIYRRYVGPIYGYCRNRLDRDDAEDATSQVFLQAMAGLESCRSQSLRPWLFTIAHNHVIDRFRSRKFASSLDEALEVRTGTPSPEDEALDLDRDRRLRAAIRALPPDQRAAVELRLAGLTGIECAQALGKSPDATRMLQHRAFATLRNALADLSAGTRHDD